MATGSESRARPERPGGLAKLLRRWRERALLTQEQLADRAGVSVGTVRGVESGRIKRPRSDSLRLLADGLGLSAAERAALAATGRGEHPSDDGPGGASGSGSPGAPDAESGPAHSTPVVPTPVVPAQLPADLSGFMGRGSYLSRLNELIPSEVHGRGAAVVISAIALGKIHRAAGRAGEAAECWRTADKIFGACGAAAFATDFSVVPEDQPPPRLDAQS